MMWPLSPAVSPAVSPASSPLLMGVAPAAAAAAATGKNQKDAALNVEECSEWQLVDTDCLFGRQPQIHRSIKFE